MFIRKKTHKDRKTGVSYCTYQLIESVRTERGPRQRILLSLNSNLALDDREFKLLANRIEELVAGIQTLIPCSEHIERLAHFYAKQLIKKKATVAKKSEPKVTRETEREYHFVDLDSLEHEHCRTVGVEHITYETFKKLRLDKILPKLGLTSRQVQVATAAIIGRLVHPASERSTHHWLANQSALDELMDTDFSRLSLDCLYRAGDNLLKHKEVIEKHLASTEEELFSLEETVFLYDLTNTYFEGSAKGISLASRGHSKERRSDCPLVTLGLVLDQNGFPKRSKILPGNISEPSTLKGALQELGNKTERSVVVLDAGIATEDNLEYLRNNGYSYIVSSRTRSCDIPAGLEMKIVKEKSNNTVRAAQVREAKHGEIHLYCESESRKQKEKSMRSLLQQRFEVDLEKVARALQTKRGTKSYSKVLERIGRLKEKHKRVAHYYDIDIVADESKSLVIAITWQMDEKRLDNRFQGAYLLRVHGLDWDTKKLWRTYMLLTEVEESFRCLKTDLGLRPVFHKIDRRVEGHLFITVLGYHIMQTILYQLRLSGMNIRWSTVQQLMSTQVRVTTTMRLKNGKQVHIRSSAKPEPDQKQICQALHLCDKPGKKVKIFV